MNRKYVKELTTEEMALQMLSMQICLGAMRAGEFPIGVLLRDLVLRRSGSGCRRLTRRAWQDSSSALGTDHMRGLFAVEGLLWYARLAGLVSLRGHWAELNRGALRASRARSGGGCDGLRMRRSSRGLWEHGGRGGIRLLGVRGVVHQRISGTGAAASALLALGGRRVASHSVGRVRGVWGRGPGSMRVAVIRRLLHRRVVRLKGRQRLRGYCRGLLLLLLL